MKNKQMVEVRKLKKEYSKLEMEIVENSIKIASIKNSIRKIKEHIEEEDRKCPIPDVIIKETTKER